MIQPPLFMLNIAETIKTAGILLPKEKLTERNMVIPPKGLLRHGMN